MLRLSLDFWTPHSLKLSLCVWKTEPRQWNCWKHLKNLGPKSSLFWLHGLTLSLIQVWALFVSKTWSMSYAKFMESMKTIWKSWWTVNIGSKPGISPIQRPFYGLKLSLIQVWSSPWSWRLYRGKFICDFFAPELSLVHCLWIFCHKDILKFVNRPFVQMRSF